MSRGLDIVLQSKSHRARTGFTVVELLVAMAVFSITVVLVTSIFVGVINSQRKNTNTQDILDNGRFILEAIARAVRQSDIGTLDGVSDTLTISHPVKGAVVYSLSGGQVMENGVALSSSNVVVSRLDFIVAGNSLTDNTQPRVTISLALRDVNQKPSEQSTINLQTTLTPRNLQIQ